LRSDECAHIGLSQEKVARAASALPLRNLRQRVKKVDTAEQKDILADVKIGNQGGTGANATGSCVRPHKPAPNNEKQLARAARALALAGMARAIDGRY
jgi:hypothetical protein